MYLLSLVSGIVCALGFAPFEWPILSLVSMATLYSALMRVDTIKSAAVHGFLFGLGLFGLGVSWVYVSMVNFGNMAPALAAVAVVLFVSLLSLFPAIATAVYLSLKQRLSCDSHQTAAVFVFAAVWVLLEAFRGSVLTGFTWLTLGYALTSTPVNGLVILVGVHGASFLLVFIAAALAQMLMIRRFNGRQTAIAVTLIVISFIASGVQWTQPYKQPVTAALVQQNVSITQKWDPRWQNAIQARYIQQSQTAQTDIVVWPEAAVSQLIDEIPAPALQAMDKLNTSLVFGGIERNAEGEYFNTLVARNQQKDVRYRKQHLVPFGEYFPFQSLLGPLFESLSIPMSNIKAGDSNQSSLLLSGIKFWPTICYEDAFPNDWHDSAASAHALINVSEDAWFGRSFAPHQRLQMARMRAIEQAKPMLRVSNTGLSALIEHNGQLKGLTRQFEPAVSTVTLQARQGATPYARWGAWPFLILLLLTLTILLMFNRKSVQ